MVLGDNTTQAGDRPHPRGGNRMTLAKQATASILGLNKGKMGGRYPWAH